MKQKSQLHSNFLNTILRRESDEPKKHKKDKKDKSSKADKHSKKIDKRESLLSSKKDEIRKIKLLKEQEKMDQ